MAADLAVLGTVDYVIFALMLLVSAGIGVFFRFSGGKQKTTEEYLLAGQDMSILPVAFSLMASFLSAITVIGVPAEMYKFGLHMAYINIGFVVGMMLSTYLSLPVFFDMQASTAYEYLERRFGKLTRTISSLAFVIQMILYMSVVLYAPALALSAVTRLSTWVSVVSIGVVCTFYCTLGGMKAVLWTDVFQAILMFLGIFAVIIKGFADMGISNVIRIAYENGRINSPSTSLSFEVRYTWLNIMMQGLILSMSCFGGNQVQIQRMLTVKNIARSRKAAVVSIPMGVGFHLLNCLAGIVIYAYYHDCDPMTPPNKRIQSADQLMPYFMMDSLSQYPGLPGLCICGIFSASLSTVSSAVNSLTAVTMQDLVRPFLVAKGFSEKKTAFSAKVITLIYGFLCVALTFLIANFGNLIQASLTVFGMLGGPVLAVFILGMMTTRSNEKGVVFGLVTGVSISAWISFGASANGPSPITLPISHEGCPVVNMTSEFLHFNDSIAAMLPDSKTDFPFPLEMVLNANTTDMITEKVQTHIPAVYRISYLWFAPIGFFVTALIGYVTSVFINIITGTSPDPEDVVLSPILRHFLKKQSSNTEKKEIKISAPMELQGINGNPTTKEEKKEKEKF